jgi:hypothetical protein
MNRYLHFLGLLVCGLGFGCVAGHRGPDLAAVGPAAVPAATSAATGTLVVHSAYVVGADFNARDRYRPAHSDYEIFTAGGALYERVHNQTGTMIPDAVPVTLPPGNYVVKAQANGWGTVSVPVVIKRGQRTAVFLEGGAPVPGETASNLARFVRLPDGEAVGWKAW